MYRVLFCLLTLVKGTIAQMEGRYTMASFCAIDSDLRSELSNHPSFFPHEYRRGNGQENFGTRYEKPFFRLPFHSTRRNEEKVVDRWPTKFLWSVRLRIFRSSAEKKKKKKKKTEDRLCIVSLCSPRDRKRLWRIYELYRSN